jgi:hypothetical protein
MTVPCGDTKENKENIENTCKHQNSIWACAGCDTVTFEWQVMYPNLDVPTQELGTAQWDEYDGGYFSTRSRAKLFKTLNPDLATLYNDVVASFAEGRLLLCTIGLRTLIEGVCADKGFTDLYSKNLNHKIDGLNKFLPNPNIIEALHALRLAGRDAAHRLEALTQEDAQLAIEIVEDLLNFLYDLDYKASQLRNVSRKAAFKSTKPSSVQ